MLNADRLSNLLKPQGFTLRYAGSFVKTIIFVRNSNIPRLFEHLNVYGQGKAGEAVNASTGISASSSQSGDACVGEEDLALMYALATNAEHHWTIVGNTGEAKAWEERLAQNTDFHCRATADSKGPALHARLQPVFSAVDRYIAKIGDVNTVFDSEYRYRESAADDTKREANQLASLIGYIGPSWDDIQLACLVLFKYSSEVEGQESPFRGKKWHEDSDLRARIYLLAGYVREKRHLYAAGQSLSCGSPGASRSLA